MSMTQRVLIAGAVLALDLVVFFFPLAAVFVAYVLIVNPPWFRDFLDRLGPANPAASKD
ncbi:MAG: hypothetical protein JRI76_02700 [Deltaproteobacteria bacterium]|nr:hypothetical protein [Deltaproteobacteria bacterium]MBW2040920.1 hypothetical protein [Deltaproteobacteria bacterium]MBW2130984.1 hypothetical protein [Deltaproteobacteria bacterium]